MHIHRTALIAASFAALALTACSDDAPKATSQKDLQAFMDGLSSSCNQWQPGFDQFYTDHPEPTADDYAAFLPSQVDGMTSVMDCIDKATPPKEIASIIDGFVGQGRVVVADMQEALDKAKAGDLDGANTALTRMHDVDQPKMGDFENQVGSVISAAGN